MIQKKKKKKKKKSHPGRDTPVFECDHSFSTYEEGRCKPTWETKFKLAWREAGPPNHHDDEEDSDQ